MGRVILQWTSTAKAALASLPKKVRRGLLDKANELRQAADPSAVHKPLTGPLKGYYRITYARYRAVYSVHRELPPGADPIVHIKVLFVAAGVRKEGDKNDIYRLAQKLVELGIVESEESSEADDDLGES